MRFPAIIVAVLALFISVNTGSAGNSGAPLVDSPLGKARLARAELERAIADLTSRSGPPGAYIDTRSAILPVNVVQHSLWQRLQSRLEFAGIEHPHIDEQIEYFLGGLFSLQRNLADAQPFLYFIVDEIDRAGLPLDLALLPLIESAYNPHAKSAQDAVGVWQFIETTARIFDLPVNPEYDGRKDVVASTRAAIRYLKKLNRTFNGDWLLAMAAYNTGPSNVRSAMSKAEAAGLDPTFWNLRLATETTNYVPRILAAIKIFASPQQYGLQLPDIENRKAIESVSVGRPMRFSDIARVIGTSVDTLEALNPGHQVKEIPSGGPYRITLPVKTSARLIAELEDDKLGPVDAASTDRLLSDASQPNEDPKFRVVPDAYLPNAFFSQPFKPYKKYVYQSHLVQPGESLWKVSRKLDTDVDTLVDWSGDSEKSLQPGDRLIVAYIDEETPADVEQKLLNYRVSPNDTLISISDKFELSISELKKWNPALWRKNHLQAGQSIKIPVVTSSGL